ncbi:retrovirus-related pol polyprotein from transposon TNT 1-94 [Tanacetum coccineum]|uniref:Retrovirus-related pol polyprotein from transposon TNT 1-94 n=1 Tax=Tanacetum coccineum TaxID=301880 RepID=A0ABQ4ZK26_9ASTR
MWAEAVTTTCYTQNRSLIRKRHNKTPYELFHDRKPDLKYFHIFGALCYPTNDSEDLGKLKPKADIGIFIGYFAANKAYRIYNRQTRMIMETIYVDFDELRLWLLNKFGSGPGASILTLWNMQFRVSLKTLVPQALMFPPTKKVWDNLFQPMFDEYFLPPSVLSRAPSAAFGGS